MARLFDMSASGKVGYVAPGSYAYKYLPSSWTTGASAKKSIKLRHLIYVPGLARGRPQGRTDGVREA